MNQTVALSRFVREADIDCVLVAGRWSLLDRTAGDELFPLCVERSVDVIVGGVFNSGLLARPVVGATYDYAAAPPDLVAAARRMAELCAAHHVSLPSAALQFAARHPAVTTVLTGARSAEEVRSNAGGFRSVIPDELWAELDRAAAAHAQARR
jgi:D-threo-aldose 1-dehydrogenase